MTEPRLTAHDQLLVNIAGAFVSLPVPTRAEVEADLAAMREVLPRVSRDAIIVRDLAVACEDLVSSAPLRTVHDPACQAPWHRAVFDLRVALERMFRWRAQAVRQHLEAEARP